MKCRRLIYQKKDSEWNGGDQSEDIQWIQCKDRDHDGSQCIIFILFLFADCDEIEDELQKKQNIARRHEQNANDRALWFPINETQTDGVHCHQSNAQFLPKLAATE